ncbi:MAG TPA: 50S ribosomal protein L17 [Bacteroidota bacterium]|nr:50S ribosomal protein L17 [Bacteroidota bacterium]
MRHRKSGRKLKRTASHRRATLGALSTALLRHKKIQTTLAKAKETRMLVEKLITKAKNAVSEGSIAGAVHARRQVGRLIKDRAVIKELFTEIVPKITSRPGGYTRVVKLGTRHGDAAEVAILELVDFSGIQKEAAKPAEEKTEKKKKAKTESAAAAE